jgi:hypothetical protein
MNDYLSKPVRTADPLIFKVLERWKLGQKWGKVSSAG